MTKTFLDNGRNYIVKILNYKNSAKVFVFSTEHEIIKDYTLIISPQNLQFHMQDNAAPLELEQPLDPESISIQFNLKQT